MPLQHSQDRTEDTGFLAGGGEMGERVRAHDWSASPLGPPESWPQSLRTAVGMVLNSRFPSCLVWGPELVTLYNDAFRPILGAKSEALGRPFSEVWREAWDTIGPIAERAFAGESSFIENFPLTVERNGYPEQAYFTFCYSPVRDETGNVAGFLDTVIETTGQILTEGRQSLRLALEERLRHLTDPRTIMAAAVEELGSHLGANRVGYSEVQSDDRTILCDACYADGVEPIIGFYPLDSFGPASIARQRQGLTEICDDVDADPAQVHATWAAIDTRAFVSVPLVREGRFTASLYVNFREPRRWSPQEVRLIEDVAARTWAAVERAKAETALRDSEARFRLTADAVPQIVWITDAEGRTEFFNRQWTEYTGVPPEPSTAATIAEDFVHPDDRVRTMAAFEEARRCGTVFEVEHRIRSHSGEYRWFLVRADPYCDPRTGEVVRWFGSSIDIHDRKVAEATLRESEEQLRLATEAAEIGLWDVDPLSDTLFWPPRVKAMFGISADRPVSMADFYAGLHPEDAPGTSEAFAAAVDPERRALYDVEYRTIGKEDGIVRWVAAKGRGVFDREGSCIRVIGTAIDITARKATEQRLRELNETLEQRVAETLAERQVLADVVENNSAAVMVCDLQLRIVAINRANVDAFERAYGRRPKPGDTLLDLVDLPEERALVARNWGRALAGDEFIAVETFGDPGRERVTFEVRFNLLRDRDGRTVGAVQTAHDVTDRVRAQEELEAAQDALRQSQKMEAMGQLTGGVAHDFNNLLTPIVGSLDMLQRKKLGNEREQRLIAGAMQSAERAKTLVQRLLAFARRQPLQPIPVDIARLVTGMGDLVASTTGPQIKVVVDTAEDLPPAMADPNQLEMALLNLSVNARDAMPEGGTLRISASAERVNAGDQPRLEAGDYVRLSVADTGSGMDEATLARAIEPFFSTKGVGRGTGLGLSMVHGLASQLGGALNIRSRPGLGTNVELWLRQSAAAPEAEAVAPGTLVEANGRGTALLVDDEELVRLSTADMLSDLGYAVIEAASAEEAIALLDRGERFDLLVTDHLMPGMNGTDLARAIRTAKPGTPVLLVSGYAETEGIELDLPRLTKPFRKDELASSLAQISAPA